MNLSQYEREFVFLSVHVQECLYFSQYVRGCTFECVQICVTLGHFPSFLFFCTITSREKTVAIETGGSDVDETHHHYGGQRARKGKKEKKTKHAEKQPTYCSYTNSPGKAKHTENTRDIVSAFPMFSMSLNEKKYL